MESSIEIIQELDSNILLYIQEHIRIEMLNDFWRFITSLGDGGDFWILTIVILLLFKKTRKIGFIALLSIIFSSAITNLILKNLFLRPRPFDTITELIPLIAKPKDYSFPSGHTTASFAVALIYYKLLPKKYGILSIILATMIAFSRLYVGVHYPSDVIGGFIVAFICSIIILKISENFDEKKKQTII